MTARGESGEGSHLGILPMMRRHWPVLLGGHIGLAGAISPVFAAIFSLFLDPMSDDLAWSHGQIALGMSVFIFTSTFVTPIAGYLLDRFGARIISLASAILLPLALVLFGLSPRSIETYVMAAIFLGVAGTLTLPITYVSILPQWFDNRLGLATAIVVSGLGTGAVASTFTATLAIANFGWQGGWFAMAGWSALLILIGRSLIPWKKVVPRSAQADQMPVAPGSEDIETKSYFADPRFWALTVAFMLGLLVTLGVQTNLASMLADRGMSVAIAATAVALTGASSSIARLVGGALLDLYPVRFVGSAIFVLQAAGCLLLAYAGAPALAMFGAALVSFAYGVEADMIPYVIRRGYGIVRFGRIYGVMYAMVQFGAIIGPLAVATTFDRLGNYMGALAALALCSAMAATLIAIAGTSARNPTLPLAT